MTIKAECNKLKIVIDVMSVISIIYALLILPVWCFYDSHFHSHGQPGSPLPIQLKRFFMDMPLFFLGSLWLIFRHGLATARKYPVVLTLRFRLLVMTCALLYGTFISILLNGK
jgi:hypothetical protein